MSTTPIITGDDDLVENPTPRVPIVLCLDTSYSMHGSPIDELQGGVETFYRSIRDDEIALHSAEVSVLTFGGSVTKAADFTSVQEEESLPRFRAIGGTPMGEAVELAIDNLEDRKTKYQRAGLDYFQPWLVLMTDGAPTDDTGTAISRIADLVERRKLSVFAIGVGENADMDVLRRFSPRRAPLRLVGLKFSDFFEWLSKSVQRVSASTPGQEIKLDTSGIEDWGTVD